jgi:sterol desaturase/sphingolipid hydroxylase (fatty acid hydroxylase superfamily)
MAETVNTLSGGGGKVHRLMPAAREGAPRAPSRRIRRAVRALRRQAATAAGVGAVAVTLTALSLSHLAHGIEIVTHCEPWEGWAMAVGIDLGFVALELSQLAIGDRLRKQVARFARPAILGTLAGSAAMNAFAFASQAGGYVMMAAAVTLGVAIPTLVYALTRVGAALATDVHGRAA